MNHPFLLPLLITSLWLVFCLLDSIQFSRAIRIAYKNDRLDEWLAQPRRMWPGSGFRLFRNFKLLVVGAVLCVIGGILMDCHILATALTLLSLGIATLIMGPVIVYLGD